MIKKKIDRGSWRLGLFVPPSVATWDFVRGGMVAILLILAVDGLVQLTTNLHHVLFLFQAEDGIRAPLVTGVQTCALPISYGDALRIYGDPEGGLFQIRRAV